MIALGIDVKNVSNDQVIDVYETKKVNVIPTESDPTVPEWAKQENPPVKPAVDATDSTAAAVKDVPEAALLYAEVVEIGGLTRKCTNLWPFGDITANAFPHIRYISLPAGTYTIRLLAQSTDTDADTCRILLKDANGEVYFWACERGVITSKTVTLKAPLSEITFDASASSTASEGDTATFTNIMLKEGDTAPYEPYFEGLRSAPVTEVESVGVNLWNATWEQGDINDLSGNEITSSETIRSDFVRVFPNTTYTFKRSITVKYNKIRFYDENKNFIGSGNSSLYTLVRGHTYGNPMLAGQSSFVATIIDTRIAYIRIVETTNDLSTVYSMYIGNYNEADIPEYSPYTRNTIPIPAEVIAKPWYGIGLPGAPNTIRYNEDGSRSGNARCVEVVFYGTENWRYDGQLFLVDLTTPPALRTSVHLASHGYTFVVDGWTALTNKQAQIINKTLGIMNENYSTVTEWKTHLVEQYANGNPLTVVYKLATPVITDISDLLPADNLIGVQGGGTVRMVSEYGYDVPNTLKFRTDNNEIIGADVFVGDLHGTAARALADDDGKQLATREWVLAQLAALTDNNS